MGIAFEEKFIINGFPVNIENIVLQSEDVRNLFGKNSRRIIIGGVLVGG